MIKKAEGSYNPAKLENEVSQYWSANDIYGKLRSMRSEGPKIYFLDGPPYTTGDIHLGTALNKSLKDLRIRYWRMNGYNVRDQPGWDMHGLPIEVNVERSFGIKSKKEIEKVGIDKFVSECKKFALKNLNNMTQQFIRLGVWMDWQKPYMTIEQSFTLTTWLALEKARENGLLFQGERSTQWCYRCGTALAEAEIEYVEREDPSVYVKMPVIDSEFSLLIWTTTPWTIPANMAVAVHPEKNYAEVEYRKSGNVTEKLIVLEEKAEEIGALTDQEEYEIIRVIRGSDLVGTAYRFPLEGFANSGRRSEWSWKVIPSESVEMEYTGLVHTAPGHGPEDFELGKKFGIEIYCPVADDGTYTEEAGSTLRGRKVTQCNETILEELSKRGLLYHSERIEHRYGTCWRCKTPVIYRSTKQWYIRATELKARMLEEIDRIKWIPDWAGSSRQAEWARNLKDWCISRQRFWGTPIPIWKCSGCESEKLVSTIAELSEGRNYTKGMDLHRPDIDAVTFECSKCHGEMRRVPDVLDVWFDSGVCSWASLNYPGDRKDFEKWWPGKWITEAGDQTRGWFNSQITTSLIMFNRAPFESAMLHGWVNDARGRQMHKSLGNVVDPMKIIETEGADPLRFYLLSSKAPWDDLSFQPDGPKNARRTLNILWNVYNFASTYMSLDEFKPSDVDWKKLYADMKTEDRWILSETQHVIKEATSYMETYEFHKALRSIEKFLVDDLSHLYVRMVRDKTWTEEEDPEKEATYTILHYVLTVITKLLAPFTPFISEEIFRAMNPEAMSVHLSTWPSPMDELRDEKLEGDMALAREIIESVLKARQETGMKLRWPLPRIIIKPADDESRRSIGRMLDIIEKQTNAKSSRLLQVGQEWEELVLTVVPNPNAIGKVYRQWSGKIAMMLRARPAAEVISGIKKGS
ncbi:MAG: isoleucine--tRNA ligase, partial [Thermoplasmata archaeon]|nr:isoleucine--tRNA ligase [Candidatus Sysuiplasma superficiale]